MVEPSDAADAAIDVEDRLRRLLRAVGRALAESGSDAVLQSVSEALVDHVGAALARIWTLAGGETTLRLRASAGMYTRLDGTHATVEVGHAKVGWIAAERRAHLTNDVPNDPRIEDPEWARREGMVAFAGLPLLIDDRVVGVMALFARAALAEAVLEELASVAQTVSQFIAREQAIQDERRRLARELHDTVSQTVYAITLAAQSGRRATTRRAGEAEVRRSFQTIVELADAAQAGLRAEIFELLPDGLEREGLVCAITHMARAAGVRARVTIDLDLGDEPDLDLADKVMLYRICQEALNNVMRHAAATSVAVRLVTDRAGLIELTIADDGRGFDVDSEHQGHLGLTTMRERAAGRGWSLAISSRPGSGTRVSVSASRRS